MKPHWKRWAWRLLKPSLALLILVCLGWQFAGDWRSLNINDLQWRPQWLFACGLLYLTALFPCPWYWRHLHSLFGYPMSLYGAVRAHYIGQLGKYVPGKAMAVLVRSELVHPLGVPYGVSIVTSFYEVFTGMTTAAIVAALIYLIAPPDTSSQLAWHPMWLGVVLLGLCGIPLLPGVFNFAVGRLTAKIQAFELYRLPPIRFGTLSVGLLATGAGWWLQGLSWWALLQAVLPTPPELTLWVWAQCTATIAFATVIGFASMIPGGFVVREVAIKELSGFAGPDVLAAAIVLRLNWVVAEVLFALATYWWKPQSTTPEIPGA